MLTLSNEHNTDSGSYCVSCVFRQRAANMDTENGGKAQDSWYYVVVQNNSSTNKILGYKDHGVVQSFTIGELPYHPYVHHVASFDQQDSALAQSALSEESP
jgi:hypothetical protein